MAQKRLLETREDVGRQEVAQCDEAVTVEALAPFLGDGGGEPAAARPGEPVRELQPRNVEAAAVERLGAEDGIVGEALGAGRKGEEPEGGA